jgi:hypothetical protein
MLLNNTEVQHIMKMTPTVFLEETDKFLEAEDLQRGQWKRKSGVYWPSEARVVQSDGSVLGECARKLWWRLKHRVADRAADARVIRIRYAGNAVEDAEIGAAKRKGMHVISGAKITIPIGPEVSISGKIDSIYRDPLTGRFIGIEYKSAYGYLYKSAVVGNTRHAGAPKIPNVMQTMLYLDSTAGTIDDFRIIYLERGAFDGNTEYSISLLSNGLASIENCLTGHTQPTTFTVQDIKDGYLTVDALSKTDVLPARDFDPLYTEAKIKAMIAAKQLSKAKQNAHKKGETLRDWQCAWCPFLFSCIKEGA